MYKNYRCFESKVKIPNFPSCIDRAQDSFFMAKGLRIISYSRYMVLCKSGLHVPFLLCERFFLSSRKTLVVFSELIMSRYHVIVRLFFIDSLLRRLYRSPTVRIWEHSFRTFNMQQITGRSCYLLDHRCKNESMPPSNWYKRLGKHSEHGVKN